MATSGSAKGKRGATKGGASAAVAAAGAGGNVDASPTATATSSDDFAGLVPSSADEFRSLEFWDGFFRARGDAAFEWYGDWRTLKPILLPLCRFPKDRKESSPTSTSTSSSTSSASSKILMLGCGNSELSAQMYDAGCEEITNVDFCPAVIREMLGKNLRKRPKMTWVVADITNLPTPPTPTKEAKGGGSSRHFFPDRGFGLVVDKGGLDALHSEEEGAAEEAAGVVDFKSGGAAAAVGLAAGVRRVLAPGGFYACVTLCQRAVLEGLLASYRLPGQWEVSIEAPPPPPDMATAPLQPLCVVVRRPSDEEKEEENDGGKLTFFSPIVCRVPRPRLDAPNAEQLADVFAVVAAENAAREKGQESAWVKAADELSSSTAAESPSTPAKSPPSPSSSPSSSSPPPPVSFDEVIPGREVEVLLPQKQQQARYVATVVDREPPPRTNNRAPPSKISSPPPTCSIFIVPQGREHEWLFATTEGRRSVAAQVGASRCVFVAAAAGRPFPVGWDAAALQRDLDPHVVPLTPSVLRGIPKAVPFVTLGEGLGRAPRKVCEVASEVSGSALLVEDIDVDIDEEENDEDEESEESDVVVVVGARRLVFGGARSLIQSEVPLVVPRRRKKGEKAKTKPAAAAAKAGGGAAAAAESDTPTPTPALSTHLPSAYHCAILAGLAALGGGGKDENDGEKRRRSVLLVGLGAGGLAAHLSSERCCAVTAAELDPRVVEVARGHFGLAEVEEELLSKPGGEEKGGSLTVVVGDGVVEVEKAAATSSSSPHSSSPPQSPRFSAIIVDAGGGDATLAMSCPPPPFVTEAFAASAAAALRSKEGGEEEEEGEEKGGVLAVNCVSRDERPVAELVSTLKGHFARVFEIDVPEDVNRVLFATGPRAGGGAEGKEGDKATAAATTRNTRPPLSSPLPRGERAVSGALDSYFFGTSAKAVVRDPGTAAGGSSVAEMADLLVER